MPCAPPRSEGTHENPHNADAHSRSPTGDGALVADAERRRIVRSHRTAWARSIAAGLFDGGGLPPSPTGPARGADRRRHSLAVAGAKPLSARGRRVDAAAS